LVADRDRTAAQDTAIGPPDAIVLTGDLIFGASLDLPDYEAELDAQYEVASDFIDRLADRFLAGDRARLVIVPGNHDIDWNAARAAMEHVAEADVPPRFSQTSCGPNSEWRW
jgi:3',5'-cyclic AMP phosphodiesterase CpdA